jgi:hypothetical protein
MLIESLVAEEQPEMLDKAYSKKINFWRSQKLRNEFIKINMSFLDLKE